VLLDRLREVGEIDWSKASLDSANDAGQKGGERTGPNPTDKGKTGSKRHLRADQEGVPLAVILTDADIPASNVFEELVDAIDPTKAPAEASSARE